MWRLLSLLVLLGMPLGVLAQKAKGLPDLSPDLMVVSAFDADKGRLTLRITQYREQEIQELTTGATVTLKTEKVIGPFEADRFLNVKECRVLEASGKAIPPAEHAKRFERGAVVVVATDGKLPAKAFLQILRPDTVIVVGPPVKPDPRLKLPPRPPE
jgi:hypothetical protein